MHPLHFWAEHPAAFYRLLKVIFRDFIIIKNFTIEHPAAIKKKLLEIFLSYGESEWRVIAHVLLRMFMFPRGHLLVERNNIILHNILYYMLSIML